MEFMLVCSILFTIMAPGGDAVKCAVRDDDISARSFFLNRIMHWPQGVIPYELDNTFSPKQRRMIEEAVQLLQNVSCVRWVPRAKHIDYVKFVHHRDPTKCDSRIGRALGMQILNLGDYCFEVFDNYQGSEVHEMIHALGFIHEQQRIDRDCYVKVAKWAEEREPNNFAIQHGTSLSFPYDFNSIMHYFQSDRLVAKSGAKIGNNGGKLTELDIMKINNMYCGGPTYCQKYPDKCKHYEKALKQCLQTGK